MKAPESQSPDFDRPDLAQTVERLSVETVNALPFGAIRLDADGSVTFFSDAERRLSGYLKEALGHGFFTEIAPCMNTEKFRGRIDRAMAAGKLNISFSFVGDFRSATAELDVRIQSASGGGCWIFLRRAD